MSTLGLNRCKPRLHAGLLFFALSASAVCAAAPLFTFTELGDGGAELTFADAGGAASLSVPSVLEGKSIVSIGADAFAACAGLRKVTLPSSVERLDADAFAGCDALTDIAVDNSNPFFSDIDGVLCDFAAETLLAVPAGRAGSYTVPSGVKAIADGAFAGCARLTGLVLPPDLAVVPAGSLSECPGLVLLFVPNGCPYSAASLGQPASCRVVYYEPGGLGDPTLPPRWAAVFKANGGRGAMPDQIFTVDVPANLRANVFARTGHTFAGWSHSAGGAVAFKDRQLVNNLAAARATKVLYARWKPIRYSIRFKANGGKGGMSAVSRTWGKAAKLPKNAFTRKGYTFSGWAKSSAGKVVYGDRKSVKNLCKTAGGTVTLYAKWKGVAYKVVFHGNGGKGATVSQRFRYGTPTALRRNTFTNKDRVFRGWSRSPNGAVAYRDGQSVRGLTPKANATVHLYARWAERNYSVRFDGNGGTGDMSTQDFVYGKARRLSRNTFKRTGYTFTGWALTPAGAVKYKDREALTELTPNGGKVILYARWRRNRYKVVFDANDGTDTTSSQTFLYNQEAALRTCTFSRENRVFAFWSKTKTGKRAFRDGDVVSNLSLKDGAVIHLYARWARPKYTVTFDANGGSGTMEDQTFSYAKKKRLSANAFTRDDHIFLGWSTSPDATEATYADAQAVKELTLKGALTLHAVWLRIGNPDVVVCLGDSITAGIHCYGLPYPSRLAKLCGLSVKNYGRGGETSGWGKKVVEDVLRKEGPGHICILFGANDAIHHVNPLETKENLRSIIRICKQYQAIPIIATPTPQRGSHARFNGNVRAIVRQVRDLAAEEHVILVDLNSAFGDGGNYLNPSDGLHLNNNGGDLMARMFNAAIR